MQARSREGKIPTCKSQNPNKSQNSNFQAEGCASTRMLLNFVICLFKIIYDLNFENWVLIRIDSAPHQFS